MIPSLAREPRSRDQIATAIDIVHDVLGETALGAYLYGSAVAAVSVPRATLTSWSSAAGR